MVEVNKKLVSYIKKARSQGMNKQTIKKGLKNKGWKDSQIEASWKRVVEDSQDSEGQVNAPKKTQKIQESQNTKNKQTNQKNSEEKRQDRDLKTNQKESKTKKPSSSGLFSNPVIKMSVIGVGILVVVGVVLFIVLSSGGKGGSQGIEIEFQGIKNEYQTGENFEGSYNITNGDKPLNISVLSCSFKEGLDHENCNVLITTLNKSQVLSLSAFVMNNEVNHYNLDSFYEEGNYSFEVSVYNCTEICESGFNCSETGSFGRSKYCLRGMGVSFFKSYVRENVDPLYSRLNSTYVKPIKNDSIEIEVKGESLIECTSDSDCTEECIGCESDTMKCVSYRCKECFGDYDCLEGYGCLEGNCVEYNCSFIQITGGIYSQMEKGDSSWQSIHGYTSLDNLSISSSNPSIITASLEYDQLHLEAFDKGTSTITIEDSGYDNCKREYEIEVIESSD